jgi:antitoxin component of MazEF toxin-antitoxin module
VKLQEQLSRKVKGKKYSKYVLTISPKSVEELGWQKGIELEVSVKGNKLIVTPKKEEERQV